MRRTILTLTASLACILSVAQVEVTLKGDIQKVLDKQCVDCHGTKKPKAGLDLSAGKAYSATVNTPSRQVPSVVLVKPGSLEDSYLWQKVSHTSKEGVGMPKTFFGAKKLPQAEMDAIKAWIQGGAKE